MDRERLVYLARNDMGTEAFAETVVGGKPFQTVAHVGINTLLDKGWLLIPPTNNAQREALRTAERALMHAEKVMRGSSVLSQPLSYYGLICDALAEVSRVLDEGRDERNEMIAT